MVRFIIGRAGSGKTTQVMHEIAKRAANNEKALTLIVPEQYSHSAERRLLGIVGDSLSLHGDVLSFKRLASRVFEELGKGFPVLDSGGKLLLLHRSLHDVSDKLEIYGDAPRRSQFLGALYSTITELRNSAVTPEALIDAANDNTALSKKLRDLGMIMESFDAHLGASGKYDESSLLHRLSELIASSSYAVGVLYFDGFNDFTKPELIVIEALMRCGAELCFCLSTEHLDSDNDAFRLPCSTTSSLIMMANDSGETCDFTYLDNANERPPELLHLETELFGYQMLYDHSNESIELFKTGDMTSECEYAAALVLRLVRSGYRWSEIAVMSHGNADYLKLCENIFMRHGIPSFRTGRDDILDSPPIKLVLSALDILSSGWDYEDVFAYLKTGLSGVPQERLDALENFVYRRGIRGQMWLYEDPWYGASEDIDSVRREVASPLITLSKSLTVCSTGGQMLRALYTFLEEISLPDTLEKRAGELRLAARDRIAGEYLQLWDIIVEALDQMYLTTENMPLDVSEFTHLLKLLLSCYDVGVIPVALDRVTIGDMAMSRRMGVKALIVIGAIDGNMPRTPDQSGVFSAAERDKLVSSLKLSSLDSTEKLLSREFNVIYSALAMSSEYLAVIYNDSPGSRPSFIVERLKKMFSIEPQEIPVSEYVINTNPSKVGNEFLTQNRGSLSSDIAESLYGKHLKLSSTRVEKFASCKFAFFMQNGLIAKPREQESFDASAAGTFIHYILEHTSLEIRRLGGFKDVTEDIVRQLTRRFTSDFIKEYYPDIGERSERFQYFLRRLSSDAERITLDLAGELHRSSFEPLYFEAKFDAPVPESEFSVTGIIDRVDSWVSGGKLYIRVSDYKTGRKAFSLSDVFYGLGMQMLIYLYALGLEGNITPAGALYTPARDELFVAKRNEPDEAIAVALAKKLQRNGLLLADSAVIDAMENSDEKLYLPVKVSGGDYSGDALTTLEQFGKLNTFVSNKLTEMAKAIGSGRIEADPYMKSNDDTACKYCKFSSACGFGTLPDDKYRWIRSLNGAAFWDTLDAGGGING